MGILAPTEVNDAGSQYILEGLHDPLTLAVCLRMVSGAEMQSRAQFLKELLSEIGGESNITV